MSAVIFENNQLHRVVSVPEAFLRDYMPCANGEYVKVYLYLLQCMQSGSSVDTEKMADRFEMTLKDIRRALNYWESKGLLKLTFEQNELKALSLLEPWRRETIAEPVPKPAPAAPASETDPGKSPIEAFALTPRQRKEAENSSEFQMFLGLVQSYQIKPILSQIDCEKLMLLYYQMNRNFPVLELLTEYCAENGKKSLHDLERLAMECRRQGLTSEKDVKHFLVRKKNGAVVMKAFGQAHREAGEAEYAFIDRWFNLYGFHADLVREACSRALLTTHEPNFQYAEGILKKWYENHISTLEQVEQNDSSHRAKAKLGKIIQRNTYSANRFNNFEQGHPDDEYDVLTEVLENLSPAGSKK